VDLFSDAPPGPRKVGILPSQEILELIRNGKLRSRIEIGENQIQPASVDLRLGNIAYEVEASFLPSRSSTVSAKIRELRVGEIDLSTPATLAKDAVFIVPVVESLALPPDISGKANPKSTTGRLDIFVRLMTDGGVDFEEVPRGYSGDLYVEIVPRTFPIIVKAGTRLNQLRFWRGHPERDDSSLRKLAKREQLVYEDESSGSIPDQGLRIVSYENGDSFPRITIARGLHLSVDLQGPEKGAVVAYKAKHECPPIDLGNVGGYEPQDYWDPIVRPPRDRVVLKPGDFYLLASRQRVSIPPTYAAEMEQYDPSLGEFTVHYAGFFDPGFGYGVEGEIKGTRAVLEVRAHEVPILLEDSQTVGRLLYHKMAGAPAKLYGQSIGSSYQQQGLALSKQFRSQPKRSSIAVAHS